MSESQPIELDPGTVEIDLTQIKNRSISGVVALTSRTLLVQLVSLGASFALTVFLKPAAYGTFFLVSAVVNFLNYFSDIGLAAALIQKKENPKRADYVTTFTLQQFLVFGLVIALFVFTPQLRIAYKLNSEGTYLMWALGVSLVFSSLKTIPTVLLERNLEFNKLVIPQIAENLVYNLVAVFFAWKGYGVTAFTLAVLSREIIGLSLMYFISPWRPSLGINKDSLRHLLHFGLPYQTNSFIAMIKDDGMTLFLGKIIDPTGLGYIGWASKWAYAPLRIFMDNVTRVTFPAYARVQHDKNILKQGIEKTLFYLTLIVFPILVCIALLFEPLVNLIPKYNKWLPALIPLYFYVINAAWSTLSTPLTNALNAVGKIKTTFKLMIMWAIATWVLMPLLAFKYGYAGVSLAAALISFTSIIVLILIRRITPVNYWQALKTPILASTGMGMSLFLIRPFITKFIILPPAVISGGLVYALIVYLIEGPAIISQIRQLLKVKHH